LGGVFAGHVRAVYEVSRIWSNLLGCWSMAAAGGGGYPLKTLENP
jgi:hypothetical protein